MTQHSDALPRAGAQLRASVLLIDKPEGVTSHAVVAMARRLLGIKRIGHLGTLDPFASGLLPLLVGGMTRLSDVLMGTHKRYVFQVQLGVQTDTLDPAGQVVATAPLTNGLSAATCERALSAFRGTIKQVPPAYSALKYAGRPLYEYMRTQGHLDFDLASKARDVVVHELRDRTPEADYAKGLLTLEALCSKGTYIRCLARDIALQLGTVGHCVALRRLETGNFSVADACPASADEVRLAGSKNDDGTLRAAVSRRLNKGLLAVRDVFGAGSGRHMPFFTVTGRETFAPPQLRERLNAGNRVRLEAAAWQELMGQEADGLAFPLETDGTLCFIETPERLFLARLVAAENEPVPEALSIEPLKLIDAPGGVL